MARLFFALMPPREVRVAIAQIQTQMSAGPGSARQIPPENLHITLVFLGQVLASEIPELTRTEPVVRAAGFDLQLRRTGFWPDSAILWLAPEPSYGLMDLAAQLREFARTCGFSLDSRAYRPHVSLFRRATRAALPINFQTIEWRVRDFALLSSTPGSSGSRYECLKTWSLESFTD